MLLQTFRLTTRRIVVPARHFLSQQCTRAAMMARIVPLGRAQPQHLRAISTPPLQNNERFGLARLQNLRHDDNSCR